MAGIYRKYARITREQFENGDYTEEELIKSYIPLALSIAKKFPCNYIDHEEAIEIALLELTRTIKTCTISTQSALTTLIKKNVKGRIKDHCLRYYKRSVVSSKSRKILIETYNCQNFRNFSHSIDFSFRIDLKDLIAKVVSSSIEETILTRALEGGYTLDEIAEEVGISKAWAGVLKGRLLGRLADAILE